jgi:hypothetical protein
VNCATHGVTEGYLANGRRRCKKCNVDAVTRRRRKLKQLALEYKGGKCELCGYDKCARALQFHHTDPNEKEFGIAAKGHTKSFEKIKIELDKCMLLCSNCHAEEHDRLENISG